MIPMTKSALGADHFRDLASWARAVGVVATMTMKAKTTILAAETKAAVMRARANRQRLPPQHRSPIRNTRYRSTLNFLRQEVPVLQI